MQTTLTFTGVPTRPGPYDLTTGGVDYLHTDLLGSIRTTTNDAGKVTSDADDDTYGQPRSVTTEPVSRITRFGYAGEDTDPTGYFHLRARYYDPTTAQCLCRNGDGGYRTNLWRGRTGGRFSRPCRRGYTFTTASASGAGAVGRVLFGGTGLGIDLLDTVKTANKCD